MTAKAPMADQDAQNLGLEQRWLELERYKAQLDFRKFVLGSVCAAIVIAAIPPLFQLATAALEYVKSEEQLRVDQLNREAERKAKEEEFQEGYIKDFLADGLSQDIELRIRLADYFTSVSPENFRAGWEKYRNSLVAYRNLMRKKIDDMEAQLQQAAGEAPPSGSIETERLERNLHWTYNELGYAERNRSVVADPRAPVGSAAQASESLFCYQERDAGKPASQRFLVLCNSQRAICDMVRGPNLNQEVSQTNCERVKLGDATQDLIQGGLAGSLYKYGSSPFPSPFPQL
jgi:hypothetical protein